MRYIKGLLTTIVLGSALALASIAHATGTCTDIAGCGGGSGSGGGGAEATATAAAPTYSEGQTDAALSLDLAGNLRTTLGTLISGEDQTNDLIKVSGGAARIFTLISADTSSGVTGSPVIVHSGGKTPMASLTGTGALTGTVTFYGDKENTTTNGEVICILKLDATTKGVGYCPQFTRDFPYYHAVSASVTGTSATVNAVIVVGSSGGVNAGFLNSSVVTSDTLVKTGAGLLQCVMIVANDSAPTAGTISILDAITAGGTPIAFSFFPTTSFFTPVQICPQRQMSYGIYIDFTTTADVSVSVSYR